jgi:spore coat protein U-like protein
MTCIFYRQLFCLALLGVFSNGAYAACTVAASSVPSPILLGTHSTKAVAAGGFTSAQATFLIQCPITLSLTLLGGASTLMYTVNNPLVLTHPTMTDQIPYEVASNSTFNPTVTTQGGNIGGSSSTLLLGLALTSQTNMQIPVYARSRPVSYWPRSGTYNSTQVLQVTGSICTISLLTACIGEVHPISGNVSVPIQMEVSKFCEFINVGTDVSFGSQSFINQATAQNWTARIQCTNADSYKIYATAGLYHNGTNRQMDRAGVQKVAYDIYHPGSTTNILTTANPLNRTGTGLAEDLTFPVKIIAGQTTPAIGNYQDTVRLVIEY